MSTQRYQIYTSATTSFDADLEISQPIRLLVDELTARRGLPTYDDKCPRRIYAFFSGPDHRRLSNEQRLDQTAAVDEHILYLADVYAPWWEEVPGQSIPSEARGPVGLSRWPIAPGWFIGGASIIMLLLFFLFLPRGRDPVLLSGERMPVSGGTVVPTVTLMPLSPESTTMPAIDQAPGTATTQLIEITATLPSRAVMGVKKEYKYTNRVAIDDTGAFAGLRSEPKTENTPFGKLRNNDRIEILSDDVVDWYQVRVMSSNDSLLNGRVGWVKRWIIDNIGVPPSPTPQPPPQLRSFKAQVVRDFRGTVPSHQRLSCAIGSVLDRNGQGVASAVLYANNGVSNTAQVRTNSQGKYSICDLGDSYWSIVLTFVPRRNNPSQSNLAHDVFGVVYVNGGPEQVASVNFLEH